MTDVIMAEKFQETLAQLEFQSELCKNTQELLNNVLKENIHLRSQINILLGKINSSVAQKPEVADAASIPV
jgi:hypothetical protein